MPLFVAMGAAGAQPRVQHVHGAMTYGVLAMDIFAVGNDNTGTAADGGGAPQRRHQEN